jgi:hypothetical protein
MIEVHIQSSETYWTLRASIIPHGGLGIAREADLAVLQTPTFPAALESTTTLEQATFSPNENRWPVLEPKFQIINQGTHLDRERFGNYHIRRDNEVIGKIDDFPRGQTVRLIKRALEIVARCEQDASNL